MDLYFALALEYVQNWFQNLPRLTQKRNFRGNKDELSVWFEEILGLENAPL